MTKLHKSSYLYAILPRRGSMRRCSGIIKEIADQNCFYLHIVFKCNIFA